MESEGRNARKDYMRHRIDGAMFVDVDELCDQNSSIPHMLPSEQHFSEHIGKVCDPSVTMTSLPHFVRLCLIAQHSFAKKYS